MTTAIVDDILTPNMIFAELASDARIQRTTEALDANGMQTTIVNSGDEAKRTVLAMLPEGAEVFVRLCTIKVNNRRQRRAVPGQSVELRPGRGQQDLSDN